MISRLPSLALPSASLFAYFALLCCSAAQEGESRFDPPHRASYLGLSIEEREDGIWVDKVLVGGAAESAGVEDGDQLLAMGAWRWARDTEPLADFLARTAPAPTTLEVVRAGEPVTLTLTPDPPLVTTARAISDRLSKNRLFRRLPGEKLETLEADLLASVRSSETREGAYAAMNTVIDRFDLSHTAVLTPWVVDNLFGDGEHYHLGLFVQGEEFKGETRYFVRSIMFGSPAREAGLRVGDELVRVAGTRFGESPRRTLAGFEARHRMFAIQVDRDEELKLTYRRKAGGKPKTITISADLPLDAVASARQSVRLIDAEGPAPIGYVHFWNVMSGENTALLRNALAGPLGDAEAIAIDLRGRGGQVSVISDMAKILIREDRPVALLIDRQARSAKEMLAHRLKGKPGITLVGETTVGAVLPAQFHELPGGAKLMTPVPVGDSVIRFFTRGARLEGVGAVPDIQVDSSLPYRAGRDPILDRATELLKKQAAEALVRL